MNKTVIQSLSRAIAILNCFGDAEELGITEISKKAGLHKSTAFNLVTTLELHGFLEQNERTGKYCLGNELFRLGTRVKSDLRTLARPYLEALVGRFKETVNLVTRDGTSVVYLEKIESPHSMRISTAVGGRVPLNVTAVGKAILAGLPDAELMPLLEQLTYEKRTPQTIGTPEKLLEHIGRVRQDGYAEDSEELEIGLMCVAAPIANHTGKAFAAISVSGPASRMSESLRQEIGTTLVGMTRELSRKLGCSVPNGVLQRS